MSLDQYPTDDTSNKGVIDEKILKDTARDLAQQFGFSEEKIPFIENLLRQSEGQINVIIAGEMTMPLRRRIMAASSILRTLCDNQKILDAESSQSVD